MQAPPPLAPCAADSVRVYVCVIQCIFLRLLVYAACSQLLAAKATALCTEMLVPPASRGLRPWLRCV